MRKLLIGDAKKSLYLSDQTRKTESRKSVIECTRNNFIATQSRMSKIRTLSGNGRKK